MSGIFGVVGRFDESIGLACAAGMAQALTARGPDDRGQWAGPDAMLGHLALHATPLACQERLPLADPESGLVITADARLDDRDGLCAALGVPAAQRGEVSDGRLLLAAWKRWGVACVSRLTGDFAFAVWDQQSRRLFCARDRLGLRPLYYRQAGDRLYFGSTARGVAAASEQPVALNRARAADFLAGLEAIDEVSTFYDGVQRLPRGHTAMWRDGRLTLSRYWRAEAGQELRLGGDGEHLEAFSALFQQSVADRMACPSPVAAMLSGGLDSSTIVAVGRDLARERGEPELAVFAAVADQPSRCIESGFIRQVIDAGGVEATTIAPRQLDDSFQAAAEEPWDDLMTLLSCLYRAARARGHCAMLDGLDGEMVCALPESYPGMLARQGRIATAWREYRGQQRNYFRTQPQLSGFLRLVAAAFAPAPARRALGRLRRSVLAPADAPAGLVSESLAAEVGLRSRVEAERRACAVDAASDLRQVCAARVMVPYAVCGIERYNRVAARHGVEARSPLLDARLLEFCLRLPWDQKSRNGWSKYLLRRLAEQRLPAPVAWRRGWEHIGWDFNVRRLQLGREASLERLARHRAALREFVDSRRLDQVFEALRSDAGCDSEDVRLVADLAAWLERHGFLG